MPAIILVAHNIRSTHNVGALFRTADGFGVEQIIISGYTPAPLHDGDQRLPHLARKVHDQIHKTALGAETTVPFSVIDTPDLSAMKRRGYRVTGLEQAAGSIALPDYQSPDKIALLIGEEVAGIDPTLLAQCDDIVEIPMAGRKESFNVSVAAGIALYQLSLL